VALAYCGAALAAGRSASTPALSDAGRSRRHLLVGAARPAGP
jgi:hypothetical protein